MNKKGIPNFIEGNLNAVGIKGNKEEQTIRFFEENKGLFGMPDPRKELKITQTDKDNLGFTHVRLIQHYNGIRVYGSELISHFSKNDELRVINGEYLSEISIQSSPDISIVQAQTIAYTDSSVSTNYPVVTGTELIIYNLNDSPILAWLVKVSTNNPSGRWEYFINAINGTISYKANRIKNENENENKNINTILKGGIGPCIDQLQTDPADAYLSDGDAIGIGTGVMGDIKDHIDTYLRSGLYYLEDNTRRANNNPHNHDGQMQCNQSIRTIKYPYNSSMSDEDNSWDNSNQAAGIDAHFYAGLTYDFLLSQFGRNGYDGNGMSMLSTVDDYTIHNNAQWDGSQVTFFTATDGNYSMAGGIDVVAHEWGHAVTDFQSSLIYESESGALNESFSDMMGVTVGFSTGVDADWLIGENYNSLGIRNLKNPLQFRHPDTYLGSYWVDILNLSYDHGGVHTNSGVPNKMFYLLAQGGTHNGITVTRIGIYNAINIIYRANAFYWIAASTFENAKQGCISAANDLDDTGNWAAQTRNAWEAVKVGMITSGQQAPTIGTITHPTCNIATGSVLLNDLPPTGTWTLTITPGLLTITGTGTNTTITGLTTGSYAFIVTNASGSTSIPSANVVINAQPDISTAPSLGTITYPTCQVATGSVVLSGLPATGTWILTRIPGGATTSGTGTGTTITGIPAGTYAYTVTNPSGCTSEASADVVIIAYPMTPQTPFAGIITQPTCELETGSVVLGDLPATGTWTLTRTPGGITTTGTGTSTTISALEDGTYTYTVTNESECISVASANVVINAQPATPTAPTIGTITHPTCVLATGSVVLSDLPATGTWTLTRTPGEINTTGTGTITKITGLATGSYNYTLTGASGCTSAASVNIVMNTQPLTPTAPSLGTITHPTCQVATGSVVLSGLPATGTWILTRIPGGATTSGTGTGTTITGIPAGTYAYTVTNPSGCTSEASADVVIIAYPMTPQTPFAGIITQPTCELETGSVVLGDLPATGTWTLTRTPGGITTTGTGTSTTISALEDGTYTYTVTNESECISVASANVVINAQPATPTAPTIGTATHPTCVLATGRVVLSDLPATGTWTLTRTPGGTTTTGTGTSTTISALEAGTFTYTVTIESGCTSAASNNVVINSQPATPGAPLTGTIVQPSCALETGGVVLIDLPATGTWTLTRTPDGTTTTGTGTSTTISGLTAETYS
ncbi:MAG: M4 family metallopeptidase, partial [Bacteroidota bacterium]